MNGEILLYQSSEGKTIIDVRLEGETVWLTQAQLAVLFQTTKQNISLHISNIYKEGELEENATVKDFLTVRKEGRRNVKRQLLHYNLFFSAYCFFLFNGAITYAYAFRVKY